MLACVLAGFFVLGKNIIHAADVKIESQPLCRRMDPNNPGQPLPCRFWTNEKGGVTGDLGVRYIRGCVEPCMPGLSYENPGVLIMDGHGSHFTLELLSYCRSIGLHVVLRPPHTTHILQGEDVVHFLKFKGAYQQAKILKLGQKILQGQCRLTITDLLDIARAPWEEAFSLANCLKAWEAIGVSPFTRCVYWDLKQAESKRAEVAEAVHLNPEMMHVQSMVGIMFGVAPGEKPAAKLTRREKDTLHSCDLWDLPGGATGDDCYNRVKAKTDARMAKEKEVAERKEGRKQAKQAKAAGVNAKGAEIVAKLTRDRSLNTWSKLLKSDIECALAYKAIELPKNAKKPELLQLLLNNICSLDNVCSDTAESSANTPEKVASASDTDSSSDCDSEHSDDSHIEIYL